MVVAQLAEHLLLTPEDPGSNSAKIVNNLVTVI